MLKVENVWKKSRFWAFFDSFNPQKSSNGYETLSTDKY